MQRRRENASWRRSRESEKVKKTAGEGEDTKKKTARNSDYKEGETIGEISQRLVLLTSAILPLFSLSFSLFSLQIFYTLSLFILSLFSVLLFLLSSTFSFSLSIFLTQSFSLSLRFRFSVFLSLFVICVIFHVSQSSKVASFHVFRFLTKIKEKIVLQRRRNWKNVHYK